MNRSSISLEIYNIFSSQKMPSESFSRKRRRRNDVESLIIYLVLIRKKTDLVTFKTFQKFMEYEIRKKN